jgi:hypothetical protein
MYQAYREQNTARQYGPWLSFVKQQFRKGYQIPGLEHQTNGVRSYTLWNTRNSVLRIVPGYDPATGEIFPQNIKCNEYTTDGAYTDHLSDTFMTASVVVNFGQQGMSFITSYAPGSPDEQRWGGSTVFKVFTKNIQNSVNAVNNGKKSRFGVTQEMHRWCDPMQGPLKYDHMALLMQALVFTVNGRDNQDADGNPLVGDDGSTLPLFGVVCIDSKASIGALMQALVEPANPGLPLNPATNNKYGSMCELDSNIMFLNSVDNPNGKGHMLRPSVQAPGKGWTPTPFPLTEEDVKSLWIPWDNLLQYMTAEEQLKYLAGEFGSDSVNYFVGTDPIFAGKLEIPQEIKAAGYGRYQQFMGNKQPQPSQSASSGFGPGRSSFGMMPKQGGTIRESFEDPVEQTLNTGYTPAPQPQLAPRPSGLSGLRANSTIDQEKLKAALNGIRGAASTPAGNQASMAANLLNDNNLDDYQTPDPEEAF